MQRTRRGGSTRLLVMLSALGAIGIILGKFLAFNVTDFMRFSLENITIIFAGIVFGPLYGAALGAVQDLVGCLAVGYAINPIITLGCALTGLLSGLVYKVSEGLPSPIKLSLAVLAGHLVGSVIVKSIGLSLFYSLPFFVTLLWRVLNYVIVGAAEAFLLYFLLKSKQLLSQINKIKSSSTKRLKTASDATAYAKSVSGVFSKPGLERVMELLSAVGSPEKRVKVVHVTGTNGKGSFSALLSSALSSSGLRVGAFNSPYLYEMRESVRICGEPISEETLVSLFERLRAVADRMTDKPTEFELLTAAAYLAFKEADVDVAIVECGMGARRDATNVIDKPLLSVITGVAKDHTSYLGDTLAAIAREKSGVIKAGCPVLIGNISGEALDVITETADALGAPLHRAKEHTVKSLSLDGALIDCAGITDVRLSLLGAHQPKNAALAITAAQLLRAHFPTVTDENIAHGMGVTVWRGRFEPLMREPLFIFDGAHNLDGVTALTESVRAYFDTKVICLTGVLADKEYEAMADLITTVASHIVTVTPDSPRALAARDYAEVYTRRGIDATAAESVEDGVGRATDLARKTGAPVVCLGSLYLYKEVSEAVSKSQK